MATIKKLPRKNGESYQICFTNPITKRTVRKVFRGNQIDAMKVKKQIEADIAFGRFNIDNNSNLKIEYLWSALETRYKKFSKANKSPKTSKRESFVFTAFNEFIGKKTKVADISNQTIEQFRDHRLSLNKKPASVALEMRHLKVVFNMGIKWEMCEKNPVVGVKQPKLGINKIRFLLKKEVNQLLNKIKEDNHPQFLNLVTAYLHTGARRIEILPPLFTWDNVNLDDRKILIMGKRDRKRFVPINDTLYEIFLESIKNEYEFPFLFKPDYVSHKIKYYYKLADIKGANLHSLRKTFGSLLLQNGAADLFTVSKLLGHSSVNTTEKYYVDLLDENFYNSVSKLTEII